MYTFYLFFVSLASALLFLLYMAVGVGTLVGVRSAAVWDALGMAVITALLWLFHWRFFYVDKQVRSDENYPDMLRFYAVIVVGVALLTLYRYASSMTGSLISLAFQTGDKSSVGEFAFGLVMTVATLPVWLYHFRVMRQSFANEGTIKKRMAKAAA
jgi:tellurite resistance protein TehA-like permease